MNKRICLVCPPSSFLADERVFPFLGILKVAASYEQQGAEVKVLDLSGIENYVDVVMTFFSDNPKFDFVGLTATSPQILQAFTVAKAIKDNFNYKLVIGGPHATLSHTAYKREVKKGVLNGRAGRAVKRLQEVFDVLVCGDGESSLDYILKTDSGVLDFDDRLSPNFMSNKEYTESPFPARHLIDMNSYNYTIDGVRAYHLLLQMGCPYSCGFCVKIDTMITMADGSYEKIQNIKTGDRILAYNEEKSILEETTVKQIYSRKTKDILRINLSNDQEIEVTPEHPFLCRVETSNKPYWIEAKDLHPGYNLFDEDLIETKIKSIVKVDDKEVDVFNFACSPNETYIAAKTIVHNCSGRNSPSLRFIRTRTTESALAEMEFLIKNYNARALNLFDDEINVNKEMIPLMYGIADLQQKYGIELKLRGFTKSEIFTEEQAKAMKAAGFKWMLTGFESGDPRILENINKKATLEDNTRCIEIANKYDLKVKALTSIGHPSESFESIFNTQEWLIKMGVNEFDTTVVSCYPGAPYYDDAVLEESTGNYIYTCKNGDVLYQKEVDFTKDSNSYKGLPNNYVSYVWTDFLTPEQLVQERDKLEATVRAKLNIPYNLASPARKYEMSYGSSRNIPDWILRSTETHKAPQIDTSSSPSSVAQSSSDLSNANRKSLKIIQ